MTTAGGDSSEIEKLRREAQGLRAERERREPRPGASEPRPHESDAVVSSARSAAGAERPLSPGWEDELGELADDLRDAVTGVQSFVQTRPGLALLAAFACGYLLGRLTSPGQEQ